MKKYLIIITILIIPFLLSGCYNKKTFQIEDYTEYLDKLQCNTADTTGVSCNIKGKYELVSDNINTDNPGVEYRIKGTDLTFNVRQQLSCDSIDGSGCFNKKDVIDDNFAYNATQYHIKKYNESIGITECFKEYISGGCNYEYIKDVKNKTDLEENIKYLNGLLEYINSIDYKFIDRYTKISFEFDKSLIDNETNNIPIYISIDLDENEKYVYRTFYKDGNNPHLYEAEDKKVETFINNFMEAKNIKLN